VLEILCRYELDSDHRVQKGFRWALANRQKDGGWALFNPGCSASPEKLSKRPPHKPVKTQPFSYHVTGMMLRAFAESLTWRAGKEAHQAAELLVDCFFQDEVVGDRTYPSDWEIICYPFWNTDILSSLDALSRIGFSQEKEMIQKGLAWLIRKQNSHGFWECGNKKATLEDHLWVTLAALRVLKRFGLFKT
ncbi:MAG: hypothetical protein FJY81_01735, partial [Candidatus Aminicenantes bacterium]|nr:hypothetical protein [Candidatus Aminicenantes bacterium]